MKKLFLFIPLLIFTFHLHSQEEKNTDKLPYYEIPEYTDDYTVGTISARMIDGLGFRYRWATEDLREQDLMFKPSDSARTILETIDHIFTLSIIIVNTVSNEPTDFSQEQVELTYEQKRKETLKNFKKASDLVKVITNIGELKIRFISSNSSSEYPFWNLITGPIEDAVWHSGQLVSFRRSSGNPMNPKVSFLRGTVRN